MSEVGERSSLLKEKLAYIRTQRTEQDKKLKDTKLGILSKQMNEPSITHDDSYNSKPKSFNPTVLKDKKHLKELVENKK